MKSVRLLAALAGVAAVTLPVLASGQQKTDLGKREYDANCAVCHGGSGRGDGPYVAYFGLVSGKTSVADLTTLAKRNNGAFPFTRVYEFIDGTQVVKAHGTREMPIWGADYRAKGTEYYVGTPFNPELYARARIFALTEYVYRLQAK